MTAQVSDFQTRFPSLSNGESTPRVQMFLNDAYALLNPNVWPPVIIDTAALYLAAHMMSMSPDSVNTGLGRVAQSESLGSLSRTYFSPEKSMDRGFLSLTSYGIEYLRLKATVPSSPLALSPQPLTQGASLGWNL